MKSTPRSLQRDLADLPANWKIATEAAALFLVFIAVMAWIQFSTPDLPDNDGYYHIRLAAIMRSEGLKPEFPWLPLTILNPREFYDHHFLFHVALIPFTLGDLRLGAKWASVIFASLSLLSVWWLLHSQRVRFSAWWVLAALGISQAFLYRISITRAQSLSLLILALGLNWALNRRFRLLFLLGFLYVWTYDAFPLLPVVAGIVGVGTWLSDGRFEWRPFGWASLGVAAGLVINPYLPYNLVFIFRHLLPKLTEATSISVGSEWFPYDTAQLLANSGFALLVFISGVLALGLQRERMDRRIASALLLSLVFGGMLFQARRFIEYFPPFALIFAAFAWNPLLVQWLDRRAKTGSATWLRNAFPAAAFLAILILGWVRTLPDARDSLRGSKPYPMFSGASDWLAANTPAGARIFQTDWDDFPRLFYYNTHNTYLVGLDPTYMQLFDPALYSLWVRITQGDESDLSTLIPASFGAWYIVSDLRHDDFLRQAAQDAGLQEVFRDDLTVVFAIQNKP